MTCPECDSRNIHTEGIAGGYDACGPYGNWLVKKHYRCECGHEWTQRHNPPEPESDTRKL